MARTAEDVRRARPERVPPHNLEAEESVLGSMMLSAEAIATVVELVKPADFYRSSHRQIYDGDEIVEYAFMGADPNAPDNRWLREAMERAHQTLNSEGLREQDGEEVLLVAVGMDDLHRPARQEPMGRQPDAPEGRGRLGDDVRLDSDAPQPPGENPVV